MLKFKLGCYISLGCMCLSTPISYGLWALLVSEMQDWIICAFLCVFTCVYARMQQWVHADHNSPKLVELISYKPYIYVWC